MTATPALAKYLFMGLLVVVCIAAVALTFVVSVYADAGVVPVYQGF